MKKQYILSTVTALLLLGGNAFAGTVNETIYDTFPNDDYANNDGSIKFSGRWIDTEDEDSSNGTITLSDNSYKQAKMINSKAYEFNRMLDLSHAVGDVNLTITTKGDSNGDSLDVRLWNKTDAKWDVIDTLKPDDSTSTNTYTISDSKYLTNHSAISFKLTNAADANWKIKDVKFSVDFEDTDDDNVSDAKDIDTDGDGILNSVEIQGEDSCGYGFYQVISGVLYVYDPEHSTYIQIGDQKVDYNGLGYDIDTGYMYAVVKEDGQDDDGTSISDKDIIRIDRQTGKIKKVGTLKYTSAAADFYDGKLYYIDNANEGDIRVWDLKTGDDTQYIDTDLTNIYDFAIMKDADDGKLYGYGINGGDLYRINLTDKTVSNYSITFNDSNVDNGELSNSWGAAFVANDNELYISNNNGYIYQITDYDTDQPKATFKYRSALTNNNDGASCMHKNMFAPDSDNDNYTDYLDSDSDNDGIPDNVEAQTTSDYTTTSGTDDDSDGLDDAYDSNTDGVDGSYGIVPVDTDKDHIPDYVDSDTDNDGYTDCEEGNNNADCDNIDVGDNGLASWAEDNDDYSDPNGNVNDPTSDLLNETGDTNETAYREFLCGKSNFKITEYQWRMISVPCDTGSNSIKDLFGDTLGTYGDDNDWVMYKQTGDDNYEVTDDHPTTNKTLLDENDTLEVGVSYWIIADSNQTLNIDESLDDLNPTSTKNSSDLGIDDPLFSLVHTVDLPASSTDNDKKFMTGNPFPYKIDFSEIYFNHASSDDYYAMGDTNNDDYILARIYTHDSSDTSDKNESAGGGYKVIDPQTPGLSEGQVVPMEGFFIDLKTSSDEDNNTFAYPLMMQYEN
jgi:hypothetical protein